MTHGLFEVGEASVQKEIFLTKDVGQLNDSLKVHIGNMEDLNK